MLTQLEDAEGVPLSAPAGATAAAKRIFFAANYDAVVIVLRRVFAVSGASQIDALTARQRCEVNISAQETGKDYAARIATLAREARIVDAATICSYYYNGLPYEIMVSLIAQRATNNLVQLSTDAHALLDLRYSSEARRQPTAVEELVRPVREGHQASTATSRMSAPRNGRNRERPRSRSRDSRAPARSRPMARESKPTCRSLA